MKPKTIQLYRLASGRFGYRILGANGQIMNGHPQQGYENKRDVRANLASLWPDYLFNWRAGEATTNFLPKNELRFILNDLT